MDRRIDNDDLEHLFERLAHLDKESFELERKKIIENELAKYPPNLQEKLRKFQWVLDMKRQKCKNPLETCFMFHDMLMDHIYGENGLLKHIERLMELINNFNQPTSQGSDYPHFKQFDTKIIPLSQAKKTKMNHISS